MGVKWVPPSTEYVKKSFYLVGSKPEIIEHTVQKLHNHFPALQLKGYTMDFLMMMSIRY
jgi:UDP-N-acetyl-D-mannosaminuronic acid transferase (WecB/TagA/CpsF family)